MSYYIDQSGKIESSTHTVLALTNDVTHIVYIPRQEKNGALVVLEQRYGERKRKQIYLWMFTAALYHVLQRMPSGSMATADVEYTGHGEQIKAMLVQWWEREKSHLTTDSLRFGFVGDENPAHLKAIAAFRHKAKADRILKADDLLTRIIGL